MKAKTIEEIEKELADLEARIEKSQRDRENNPWRKDKTVYTRLENVIKHSILAYPSLHNGPDKKISRIAVLDHFFLVSGNGLAWTPTGYMTNEKEGVEFEWKNSSWVAVVAPPYNPNEPLIEAEIIYEDIAGFMESWRQHVGWKPYAAFHNSAITRIPDNIQPDWLEGAIEITKYTLAWYENLTNYDFYMQNHRHKGDEAKATDIRVDNIFWLEEKLVELEKMRDD